MLVGCAGPGTLPAGAWASSVCGLVLGWNEEVTASLNRYGEALGGEPTREEVRAATEEFLDRLLGSIDRLSEAVEGAGRPDLPDGERVAETVRAAIAEPRAALTAVREDVGEGGRIGQRLLRRVGSGIAGVVVGVWDVFNRAGEGDVGGEPLAEAFAGSEACRELDGLARAG